MRTNYLLFFLAFTSLVNSQNINWVKKTSLSSSTKGILSDKEGNIYQFGSRYSLYYNNYMHDGLQSDTTGSFINKYSPTGQLLSVTRFRQPFWIQEMIHDGYNAFYFTGSFYGTQKLGGLQLQSIGDVDGMVGKMDESGHILWITALGGIKPDMSNSITFNAEKNKIVITGGIADSLFINDTYINSNPQRSTLVARFDLDGNFLGDKLFDFESSKNFSNFGYRIRSSHDGTYFLLGDREGKNYEDDTIMAPVAGDYLFKLDESLSIVWSELMISNACYYGYKSGKLAVTDNGEVYIPTYCSQKYGGEGTLQRRTSGGTRAWNVNNKDGAYQDIFTEGNDLYVIGTEGATICPCPENYFGYQVIRQIDKYSSTVSEIRLNNVSLTHITRSNGITYVSGEFLGESVLIGGESIKGTNTGGLEAGTFLLALGAGNATGLSQLNSSKFSSTVYPNPTSGVVYVSVHSKSANGMINIRVINVLGQVVRSMNVANNSSDYTTSIDLSGNVKGIYFIEIVSNGQKEIKRVVLD